GSAKDFEAQRGGGSQGSASREYDQQGNERQVQDAERKGGASERGDQMRPRHVAKLGSPTAAIDRDRFVKLPRDGLDRCRDDHHRVGKRPPTRDENGEPERELRHNAPETGGTG